MYRTDENMPETSGDASAEDTRLSALTNDTEVAAPHAPPSQPDIRPAAACALALAAAACGGGGGGSTGGGGPPVAVVRKPQTDAEAARFLSQTSLSASSGAITELRSEGYGPWLDRQFAAANSQTARTYFADRGFDRVDANKYYFREDIGDYMIWSQLLAGGNSVRKRVAFALSEFFVVSLSGIDGLWRGQAMGEYWDILNRHAFGNFRELLQDITLNPAMGMFLNTLGNRAADGRGRMPDENYAREVMQLFTIGLFELNQDGTNRLQNGRPIETYSAEDVSELAKVFTGYDYDLAGITFTPEVDSAFQIPAADFVRRPMTADPARWVPPRANGFHSAEAKSFLGLTIPAGTSAAESLRRALDHLFNHANVAPFFSRQMIQRLVTSNPSPAYVSRVAAVFANNGQGQRGDLRAVFKAIFTDDEALDPAGVTNANFGKLREPVLRFVQMARTFGVRSNSGSWVIGSLGDPASGLAQSPLRSPSVFNFFRPGYFPPNTEIANRNLLAPEFQLVNETSVAGYVNFIERAVIGNRFPLQDIALDFAAEIGIAQDSTALLDRLDLLLTGRQLSPSARDTIRAAMEDVPLTATSTNAERLRRVQIGVVLVLATTDYLIQK